MAKRRFNWKLAVVLLLALIVLGFTVASLRIYQRTKQAEDALQAGILAYEEERWSDAATSLGQYIVHHQDDMEILLKYANAQLQRKSGSVNQAISAYRAVLRQDPSNQEAIETLTQLYLAPGVRLPGEAELVAERYIKLNPEDAPPEIRLSLAQAQIKLDKTAEAARTLDDTIRLHSDFVPAYEAMGMLAEQEPRDVNHPAYHWLDLAVAENPQSPAALLARAEYFLRQNQGSPLPEDFSAIESDLEQAKTMAPGQVKDNPRLEALRLLLEKPESAGAHLAAVRKEEEDNKEEDNPELWQYLAYAAIMRDMKEAEALVSDSGQINTKLGLASLWLALNETGRAGAHLAAVRKEEEDNPLLWWYLANEAKGSRSPEKMARVAEEGLAALEGKQESFLFTAAELFILAERPDQAQDCIDKMGANENLAINVAYLQGRLLHKQPEYRAAIAQYRRALELELDTPPDRPWPYDERVRQLLVDSLQRVGDSDASLVELQSLVSKYPRTFAHRMMLARALAGRQQWEEARTHAREASYLDPDNKEVALLQLEISISLLSTDAEAPENAWGDIESRLGQIEEEHGEDERTRRLRRLIVMGKKDFKTAEEMLRDEEPDPNAPDYPQWLIAKAHILSETGNSEGDKKENLAKAEELLRLGINQDPNNIPMVGALERHYLNQGKRGSAIELLEDVNEAATDFAARKQFTFELVRLYDVELGEQAAKGTVLLEKLRLEAPRDIQILRGLLSRLAIIQDAEKAQGIVDLIRETEGEDGSQWRFEQARLWLSSEAFGDRRGEVTQLLEEVLRSNPADQASRELLADVQASSGNMQLAISNYREALDLFRCPPVKNRRCNKRRNVRVENRA